MNLRIILDMNLSTVWVVFSHRIKSTLVIGAILVTLEIQTKQFWIEPWILTPAS